MNNTFPGIRKRILFLLPNAAFDNAPEAGSKTVNFYLSKFAENPNYDVRIVFVQKKDEPKFVKMVNQFQGKLLIDHIVLGKFLSIFRYLHYRFSLYRFLPLIASRFSLLDIVSRFLFVSQLKKIQKEQWHPDVTVLEWPEMIDLARAVRSTFPNTKIVLSAHDVLFQRFERYIETGSLPKVMARKAAANVKAYEVSTINHYIDHVLVQSVKDKQLFCEEGINEGNILVISPFYVSYKKKDYGTPKKIMFWGAMNRNENIEAAKWFVLNVFNQFRKNNAGIELIIVGNGNADLLKGFEENEGVTATGFVKDPAPFFNEAFCMVAPLMHGAGIKVKVIEGMSSGLPVLTNSIGIEGIDAEQNKDFYFCEKPEDYKIAIEKLIKQPSLVYDMGINAKGFIERHYNYETDFDNYNLLVNN